MGKDFKRILWILCIFLIIATYVFADSPKNILVKNGLEKENANLNMRRQQPRPTTAPKPINTPTTEPTLIITTSSKSTPRVSSTSSTPRTRPTTTRTTRARTTTTRKPITLTSPLLPSTDSLTSSTSLSSILTTAPKTTTLPSTLSSATTLSSTSATTSTPPSTLSSNPATDDQTPSSSTSTPSWTTTTTTTYPWIPPDPTEPPPEPEPTDEPINPPYLQPTPDEPKEKKSEDEEKSDKAWLIGLAVGIPLLIIILCILLCLIVWCYRKKKDNSQKSKMPPKKNETLIPPQPAGIQPNSNPTMEKQPSPHLHHPSEVAKEGGAKDKAEKRRSKHSKLPVTAAASLTPIPKSKPKTKYYQDAEHISYSSLLDQKGDAAGGGGIIAMDVTQNQSDIGKDENNLGPDKIPAEAFVYKGPLVLKKYGTLDLHHELENEPERKVLSNEHVTWDDQHQVHEMGSEVEIVVSNRSKASQKGGGGSNPLIKTELETDETDAKSSFSRKENS